MLLDRDMPDMSNGPTEVIGRESQRAEYLSKPERGVATRDPVQGA